MIVEHGLLMMEEKDKQNQEVTTLVFGNKQMERISIPVQKRQRSRQHQHQHPPFSLLFSSLFFVILMRYFTLSARFCSSTLANLLQPKTGQPVEGYNGKRVKDRTFEGKIRRSWSKRNARDSLREPVVLTQINHRPWATTLASTQAKARKDQYANENQKLCSLFLSFFLFADKFSSSRMVRSNSRSIATSFTSSCCHRYKS